MSPRSVIPALLALTLAPAAVAQTDTPRSIPAVKAIAASPAIPLTLASLFETSTEVTVLADGSSIVEAPVQDVLIAHRDAAGKVVVTCVATPEAAAKLLTKAAQSQQQPSTAPEVK